MRPIGVAMALCLSAYGLAQGLSVSGSAGSSSGNGFSTMSGGGSIIGGGRGPARSPLGVGNLQLTLREPPLGSAPRGLSTSYHGRSSPGKSYFMRTVMDGVNHEYFGYEVLLVEQQSGTYLATFGLIAPHFHGSFGLRCWQRPVVYSARCATGTQDRSRWRCHRHRTDD